jgi:hypothetical protein
MRTFVRPLLSTLLALAGCATPPPPSDTAGWQPVALPGKRSTSYDWTTKEGRPALRARADQSASLLRRTLTIDPDALGDVRFSWWVDAPLPGADLAAAGLGDSPARILFAFDGNHSTLSARNRLLFDLAESVGGERPPFATLMYVYGSRPDHLGRTLIHTRTDRVRKIVLDAGPGAARRWREHRRNLAEDYRQAFGEAPGRLLSVAVLTDADNTRQTALAWYGPIEFLPADAD